MVVTNIFSNEHINKKISNAFLEAPVYRNGYGLEAGFISDFYPVFELLDGKDLFEVAESEGDAPLDEARVALLRKIWHASNDPLPEFLEKIGTSLSEIRYIFGLDKFKANGEYLWGRWMDGTEEVPRALRLMLAALTGYFKA